MLTWIVAGVLAQTGMIDEPNIVPRPASVTMSQEPGFDLRGTLTLVDRGAPRTVQYVKETWSKCTHFREEGKGRQIIFEKIPNLAREGYALSVARDVVTIQFSTEAGAFYGFQSLRQMLPVGTEEGKQKRIPILPACTIQDEPRFGWRGLHLDVSRHFFKVSFIKKMMDGMVMQKLNVFHWHLVDDGGWRLEIKRYPELTSRGGFRSGADGVWAAIPLAFPANPAAGTTYGGFYTQEEVKDVLKYAEVRHITVLPEIEMPGHNLPALTCFPQLRCRIENRKTDNVFCPGKDESFKVIENILDEVCDLFPSPYIHIGGDEVDQSDWLRCPDCKARMNAEKLTTTQGLQSYFIKRIDGYLMKKGKHLMGWDEILEGGLAPGAAVMSWRGTEGGIQAARQGKNVVMSPTSHCYFDYSYAAIPTEKVYSFEPVPSELSDEEAKFILGGQANVWTEWISDEGKCEAMTYPRLAALAEVLWTPKARRNWDQFSTKLPGFTQLLVSKGFEVMPDPVHLDITAVIIGSGDALRLPNAQPGMPWRLGVSRGNAGYQFTFKELLRDMTPGEYHFANITASGRVGPTAQISVVNPPAPPPLNLLPGVVRRVQIKEFPRVPDATTFGSDGEKIVTNFLLSDFPSDAPFALQYQGFIVCQKQGIYQFKLTSDDGSCLKVAGAIVIDNDGPHSLIAATGAIYLNTGTYPLELVYFQAGGAKGLQLEWAPPGANLSDVPSGVLFHAKRRYQNHRQTR